MGLIFSHLYFLSFCGLLTVTLGYDFFHTKNPNGAQGVLFLILGGATLFFVLQLISAFTDPLPPAHRAPLTDRQKRTLFIVYAFLYVAMMTPPILILVGTRLEFSAERVALIFGFGLLVVLLLSFSLHVFRAIYMFWKDRKTSSSMDKT
jgi:predicted membrane channel-forming protein YqfA (hemolysin III family)